MPLLSTDRTRRPVKLASKLLDIRLRLNESQGSILKVLGLEEEYDRAYVSKWERDILVPPLHVLCAYADAANIYLDVLARDVLELPLQIPAQKRSMGLKIDPAKKINFKII